MTVGLREHLGVWIAAGVIVVIVIAAAALLPLMLTPTYVTGGVDPQAPVPQASPAGSP